MDDLDRKILEILQRQGRITNAELARVAGLAPSSMLDRVRRLEESGAIRGYGARIDPKALGLNVQGFISLSLVKHEAEAIVKFEAQIENAPYVVACYHLTGRFDYLLHVAVRDLEHMGEYIKTVIAGLPFVARAETFLVLSEHKPASGFPIEPLTVAAVEDDRIQPKNGRH